MDSKHQVSGITALVWAGLVLIGFTLTLLWSQASGFNVYNVETGWRVLVQQPILAIGKQLIFAWSGAAFVFMVVAFYEWLPIEMRSYSVKTAAVMGLIAGAMFLFAGLMGGFASRERT